MVMKKCGWRYGALPVESGLGIFVCRNAWANVAAAAYSLDPGGMWHIVQTHLSRSKISLYSSGVCTT